MPQDRSHPKQIEETVWALTQIKRWWTQLQGKLTLWMILTLPNLIFPRLPDIMWWQVVFREAIYLPRSFFSCRKILSCVRFISNIGSLHYEFYVMGKKRSSFWRIFILNEVDSSLEWQRPLWKTAAKFVYVVHLVQFCLQYFLSFLLSQMDLIFTMQGLLKIDDRARNLLPLHKLEKY